MATFSDLNQRTHEEGQMTYTLPDLPYAYDALEPVIDAQTMTIHHTQHHQTYVDKLNQALSNHPEFHGLTADQLVKRLSDIPESIRTAVRNHGGGHANHSFFWPLLKRNVPLTNPVKDAIERSFKSYELFERQFSEAAVTLFGSGWVWLVTENENLKIIATPNQDNPLMKGQTPILGIDVWEHAYYLKYQNRRPDYVKAFFSIINWEKVNEHYEESLG
jgi:Fe-Mn family superoxide dismutase